MNVNVLLFAQARQIAAKQQIEIDVPTEATVADLRKAIEIKFPDLASLLVRSTIAIDQQYAVDSDVIPSGAEVAMIPPVSGG